MRILVLSDTHLSETKPEIPVEVAEELENCDLVIHAGDFVDASILDRLKKSKDIEAVCGNMDSGRLQKMLPEKKIIEAGKFRIGIIHGRGAPDSLVNYVKEQFKDEKLDCVVYGHTHEPKIEVIDGTIYMNPGSPTDEIYAPYRSYGVIEINGTIVPKIIRLKS